MKLYIEQTPIDAEITEAIATDSAGGQADSLKITLADGRLLGQWEIRQGLRMSFARAGSRQEKWSFATRGRAWAGSH